MSKKSAGILLYKYKQAELQVMLVHPGGPFYAKKDIGVWSVPKGEFTDGEEAFAAALREFKEETGSEISGHFIPLKPIKQSSGKVVQAWAVHGDLDTQTIHSNTFSMEWPPKSGKHKDFAEVDKGAWFAIAEAKEKINVGQVGLLNELVGILGKE